MTDTVWVDGRVVPAAEPQLFVTDRGFQLGDGVFETARARRGVVIELEEHLARLRESAAITALPLPADDATIVEGIAGWIRPLGTGASLQAQIDHAVWSQNVGRLMPNRLFTEIGQVTHRVGIRFGRDASR